MMSNEKELLMQELDHCKAVIEKALELCLLPPGGEKYATLIEAMRYSLLDGGKRIRAILCLKFCEAVCGSIENALPAACAIEMLHAYTLIHDDLPCMDDDSMRRGKPSNHVKYNEYTAVLSGDALQACVFQVLLSSNLPPEATVKMAQIMAEAAGPHGVCGGQYLDLAGEGKALAVDELLEIYSLKTSSLICTAAVLGVMAGGGTQEQADSAGQYAGSLGLAFQVRDDILDCTSTEKELGKPIGSDAENEKTTLVSLLGVEKCEQIVADSSKNAINALDGNFAKTEFLKSFAYYLSDRKN